MVRTVASGKRRRRAGHQDGGQRRALGIQSTSYWGLSAPASLVDDAIDLSGMECRCCCAGCFQAGREFLGLAAHFRMGSRPF